MLGVPHTPSGGLIFIRWRGMCLLLSFEMRIFNGVVFLGERTASGGSVL
jgi:hypothetical protein